MVTRQLQVKFQPPRCASANAMLPRERSPDPAGHQQQHRQYEQYHSIATTASLDQSHPPPHQHAQEQYHPAKDHPTSTARHHHHVYEQQLSRQ
mmetsp:Transcript_16845/g.39758  ORF Transcript_16845/g.39758 Transcript_16845/m.39758 type:complete len:93 (-) Transcript_16845:3573-3851(-)